MVTTAQRTVPEELLSNHSPDIALQIAQHMSRAEHQVLAPTCMLFWVLYIAEDLDCNVLKAIPLPPQHCSIGACST